jgi:peptidyl-prolyl cis-trans isomerase SurA
MIIPAHAQVLRIAVVVNEEVISALDVENRLRFNLMSANLADTKQNRRRLRHQVLSTLVDEKLQMQESKRLNISVNDSEISDAERILEAQNNLPPGSLKKFLKSRGLDKGTLMTKIHAEIAWGKILRRQILSRIDISDEEIDEVFNRLQSRRGTEQRLVSEIFLAVDSLDQTENVHQLALRLVRQIREGSEFSVVAQQFSQGVTSRMGGDIGWVGEGELATELEQTLAELSAGKVSNPISSSGGYYILFLRDKRRLGEANALDARVNLKQILIPIPASTPEKIASARIAEANRISEQITGCETFDMYGRTMEVGEAGDLGTVRMGDVPQNVRDTIESLRIGQASVPMKIGQDIRILMVCDRQKPEATLPDRSAIRDSLGRQRLAMMSRRYLRDLRHDAVIETR